MTSNAFFLLLLASLCGLIACTGASHTPIGGETNWLSTCDADDDCGEAACVCGLCTERCAASVDCPASGVVCQPASSDLVTGACGSLPSDGLCAPACERDADCPGGQLCLQGACAPGALTSGPQDDGADVAAASAGCGPLEGDFEPAYMPVMTNCDGAPQSEPVTLGPRLSPMTAIVQRPTYSVTTDTNLVDCELHLRQEITRPSGRVIQRVESVELLVAGQGEINGRVSVSLYDEASGLECSGTYDAIFSRSGATRGAIDE